MCFLNVFWIIPLRMIHTCNGPWFNPSKTEWLWVLRLAGVRVLDGVALPQRDTVCNLGVLLELWILLEEQMVVVAKGAFAHLQAVEAIAPFPELGVFAHYHSCSCDLLSGLLQCALPGIALEERLEAPVGTECSCTGCKWCWLQSRRAGLLRMGCSEVPETSCSRGLKAVPVRKQPLWTEAEQHGGRVHLQWFCKWEEEEDIIHFYTQKWYVKGQNRKCESAQSH